MKIITIFNNKGGVGKTTHTYHIAHLLAKEGKTVLIVDLDSQCNLSAYSLADTAIKRSWGKEGNSIWRVIEPVYEGLGDFWKRKPSPIKNSYPNLHIVPGDVLLSDFEDALGDSWSSAKGGNTGALRKQSAIYRYIQFVVQDRVRADVVMLDLGPNLGALNRSVLAASDYFIVPMSPDLFSIRGTKNLGAKLANWAIEWEQCKQCNKELKRDVDLPRGKPVFLGYVMQQYNRRGNSEQMTKGWSMFGDEIEDAVKKNIIDVLNPLGQVHAWGDNDWNIGQIPNLHSLIPYSLAAKKPVFDCDATDGLNGAHITQAKDSEQYFKPIVEKIIQVLA